MSGDLPLLTRSFLSSPVVDRDGYPYFVNPVSDGIPLMTRELLDEVVGAVVDTCDLDCDVVLAPEAMGIPLAAGITLRTGIPYAVIRKRMYGLPGEIRLDQHTGYSASPMYVNGVSPGERVAIVDDVISTGGTVRAIVGALRAAEVEVTEFVAVYSKQKDVSGLSGELGIPVRYLLAVSSEGGRPALL